MSDRRPIALRGISSMAMRNALAGMSRAYERRSGHAVAIESVGGVVAARRVASGEPFDFAVLAADALASLAGAGHLDARTSRPLARSSIAVAVRAGADRPDVGSESALRNALLVARRIGYSTGPSGDQLLALLGRWGLAKMLSTRLVQAPPGVPVAALVARGQVELGFQQLSEVADVPGVDVVGVLPKDILPPTIFAGAVCTSARSPSAARDLIAFFASADAGDARRCNGLDDP